MAEEDLHELAGEARLGSDPNAPKINDQHLVSEALLRAICTMTQNGPGTGHYSKEYGAGTMRDSLRRPQPVLDRSY
jgi:hypothetical protein